MFNSAQKDEKISVRMVLTFKDCAPWTLCGPTCVPPPLLTTKLLLAFSV